MLSYGKIVQVSGPVVDCEFQEGQLPKIREALRVQVEDEVRTMEVAQHMDEHTVRCIMLAPSEGLSRGMTVEATGRGISVPVGDATLGRMFNVLGDPIDGGEALPASTEKWSIHRQAPSFAEQSPVVSILETGIKVIDLLELHQLLLLFLGVIFVLLLDLIHQRLKNSHLCRGFLLMDAQGEEQQFEE